MINNDTRPITDQTAGIRSSAARGSSITPPEDYQNEGLPRVCTRSLAFSPGIHNGYRKGVSFSAQSTKINQTTGYEGEAGQHLDMEVMDETDDERYPTNVAGIYGASSLSRKELASEEIVHVYCGSSKYVLIRG
ncbi:hypothetical protein QFC21_007379 [Naganishia friedmannii]|uniref:Uncharacterized protein n=1 Tax=Naganishia friedmannii TaxID=89922 RepID=A0ACC2UUT5_9TREE|nr:hypothetical protein QFC21_007379 [Naganishia friedmannii]